MHDTLQAYAQNSISLILVSIVSAKVILNDSKLGFNPFNSLHLIVRGIIDSSSHAFGVNDSVGADT